MHNFLTSSTQSTPLVQLEIIVVVFQLLHPQANFKATDAVAALYAFVDSCIAPELEGKFFLYTTPPRQVLKDLDATLYHAQLVPAAHVHCQLADDKVRCLTLD